MSDRPATHSSPATQSSSPSRDYELSFKLFLSGKLQAEQKVESDSITIGRAGTNLIRLDDERVSDLHAVVKVTKDRQLVLTDLGSDEGTFIGSDRVDMRSQIKPGARVRVGPFEVLLELIDRRKREAAQAPKKASDLQREKDASEVIRMLFAAWDRADGTGTDNTQAKKVLEVYEVWGDLILSGKQFPADVAAISLGSVATQRTDYLIDRTFLPADQLELTSRVGGKLHLLVSPEYEGWLYQDGQPTHLPELASRSDLTKVGSAVAVPLDESSRFIVQLGNILLVGGFTLPAKKLMLPFGQGLDTTFAGLLVFFSLFIGSFTLYIGSLPEPDAVTIETLDDRFAEMLVPKKPEPPPEKKEIKVFSEKKEEKKVEEEKPKEVKEGKKDTRLKLTKDKVALDQAAMDKKVAESSGILADLKGGGSLFNTGLGGGISNAASGLLGTTGKSSFGGVTGSRGLGFGGGGPAEGVGGLGTRGGGGGGGDGYGKNAGLGGRKKQSASIDAGGGDAVVLGNIDKAQIEKVIRDNLNQIRYCYVRELNKNPTLAGKIVVRFTISPDGSVPAASTKESTMGSGTVEDCINQRIMQLRFPEPKGGGKANVVYPFIFKAAG